VRRTCCVKAASGNDYDRDLIVARFELSARSRGGRWQASVAAFMNDGTLTKALARVALIERRARARIRELDENLRPESWRARTPSSSKTGSIAWWRVSSRTYATRRGCSSLTSRREVETLQILARLLTVQRADRDRESSSSHLQFLWRRIPWGRSSSRTRRSNWLAHEKLDGQLLSATTAAE